MRADPNCPYCHGNGETPFSRDPDIDIECVCTFPPVKPEGNRIMLNTLEDLWDVYERQPCPVSVAVKDTNGRLYLLGMDEDHDFYQGLPSEADENGEHVNNSRLYGPATIREIGDYNGPVWPLELLGTGTNI